MRLTARRLNRATLARQLLLHRESLGVADGVRRVVALQAQHPASPYLAMWNRLVDFDPAELGAAFATGAVIKATLMRITLHAVHANDYQVFHQAVQPTLRGVRLGDKRFTGTGLDVDGADALIPDLLKFASQPRTNADAEAWIAEQVDAVPKGVWWAIRTYAPVRHAVTGGPWSFGLRPSYVASGIPPAVRDADRSDAALEELVGRYLSGFGPASIPDIAQFSLVQRTRARKAIQSLRSGLRSFEGPDGVELFDLPDAPLPDESTPAPPRLLGMWDNILLAYADRSRLIPPDYRKLVIRANGDVLPTLLVDGQVAGVWRPVDGGIEATAFHSLDPATWQGLDAEAGRLLRLLADREPRVYSRHNHWWATLPAAEARVLPG